MNGAHFYGLYIFPVARPTPSSTANKLRFVGRFPHEDLLASPPQFSFSICCGTEPLKISGLLSIIKQQSQSKVK